MDEPLAAYSAEQFANNLDDLFRPSLLPPPQVQQHFEQHHQQPDPVPTLVYQPNVEHDDAPPQMPVAPVVEEVRQQPQQQIQRQPQMRRRIVSENFDAPFEPVPPHPAPRNGVLDMYCNKRRDMLRVLAVAMTVTLGLSLFWFAKKLFKVLSTDVRHSWTPSRAVAAYASLPMTVFVILWTLKAFFPLR